MEGFGDVFADVHFEDAFIPMDDKGGNAGNSPSGDTKGQSSGSLPGTEQQGAGQKEGSVDKGAQPDKKEAPVEKPLPFDQDPKWKKARAAEAALDALKNEFGVLDVEELKQLTKQGIEFSKILKGKDINKILEDAAYADKVRKTWDSEEQRKQHEGEDPDSRASRLEQELTNTKKALEDYRAGVEDKEHAKSVIDNFVAEVNRVVDVEGAEAAFSDPERQLLSIFLGVNNPANMIDIEDKGEVRKMALNGTRQFRTLMKQIADAAIEKYVAGKKDAGVDTGRGSDTLIKKGGTPNPGMEQRRETPGKGILTAQEIDSTFDSASREFTEVLLQGMNALT